MAKRNPVARTLADRCFHQRILPGRITRYDDLAWLDEWDDIEGAELDVVEHFKRTGVIDDSD